MVPLTFKSVELHGSVDNYHPWLLNENSLLLLLCLCQWWCLNLHVGIHCWWPHFPANRKHWLDGSKSMCTFIHNIKQFNCIINLYFSKNMYFGSTLLRHLQWALSYMFFFKCKTWWVFRDVKSHTPWDSRIRRETHAFRVILCSHTLLHKCHECY